MSWESRLAELKLLVQPPAEAYGTPIDWAAFEGENTFLPPADYRALLDRYGAGTFEAGVGGLTLHQPLHPQRTFLEGCSWIRDNLRGLQREFPEYSPPWPIYPEPGGFLPFGVDDTRWTVGWLTRGAPEEWITCIDGDGWWDELPVGALELVMRWARGDLGISAVDRAAPGGTFIPSGHDEYWSAFTATANVTFGPSPGSASLPQRDLEWVRARVAPAKVRAFGASGDAQTLVHGELTVGYRPADEALVVAALRALATELGTSIAGATALDGSPIWPDLSTGDPRVGTT